MKKNKLFYITLIISFIPLIVNLIAYPHMPDKVPVHWGITGEPNRYGSKMEQIMLSVLPLVLFLLLNFLPSIDPKKESYKKHTSAFSIINFVIILFLIIMNLMGLFSALGYNMQFQKVLPVLLGILFIVLGNFMTQLRHNYFFGFRTPWTLASEYVWKKTHRFGGYVFVVIGLVPLSSIIIGPMGMYLFLGAMAIGIALILIYSYLVFKKEKHKEE
ncbi:SdpI family protein [Bacillus sp. EB600]|uniref:SdpI family protein n=1 Tax=Bacillus sp. EB600 TaxID=2806345 RepID=UPI00210DCE23|nr:SdpI family protein [Bacillus sp. EB600]MCQ6282757.1 SdpI family protein [Bacillus sp. EB600]